MAMKFSQFLGFFSFLSCGSRDKRNPMNPGNASIILFSVYCLVFTVYWGCASIQQKENVLAVVNSEPITEDDLKYSLQISHRREDLSSAGAMDISQFIQKLIDDKLIIQEAYRMGMDEYPEVQQAIQAYILRESVVRLHDEEIVKKVTVTEEDIKSYYKKNYEKFSLGIIEAGSEQSAQEILEQLKQGMDFKELAQKYSTHSSQKAGGEVVMMRNSILPQIWDAIANFKLGEFSDVLKIQNKYYIIKFIGREEAPDGELASVRERIEKFLRKQKEKERSDEYLKYLREHQNIKINQEILSSLKFDGGSEEIEKLSKDERTLVDVNGSVLTVSDFVTLARSFPGKSKEVILNDWIDRKVVDQEALSRHYELKPELRDMVDRYKNQLLKNTFIKRVVVPQISLSDKMVEEYYLSHQKSFIKPVSFKIQQITVKTMDEAQDILSSLQKGADFSWLAKNRSVDSAAQEGGDIGWHSKAKLPEPVREIIDSLKPGDISPVIKLDSQYRIVRLHTKREEGVEEFDKVKNAAYKAAFEEQLNSLLKKYTAQLKADAQIKINDDAVRLLEERLQK